MSWHHPKYDPKDSKTFRYHFGSPQVTSIDGPLQLFWADVGTIISKLGLLPYVLSPFKTDDKDDELYLGLPEGWATWYLSFWSIAQATLGLIVVIGFIIGISVIQLLTTLYNFFIWRIIQGPDLQVWPRDLPQKFDERQRWVYINGIATGKTTLQQELKVLSETFHAPVLGVNNRTYGFLGDLVECILERSFGFSTVETQVACPIIKTYLQDTAKVDKVILIAHSQGGILASQVLDQLYSELAWDHIHNRLEVYTFGSAALHFKNPWLDATRTKRLVTHMEHYCHEKDMVTAFGALASVDRKKEPYLGRVFVAKGWKGHLMNQHYLKHMFPGPLSGFLTRLAVKDPDPQKDKYYVYGDPAGIQAGTVKDLSHLWTYM